MTRSVGYRGTFVISWAQTEIDGIGDAALSTLTVGAQWRWWGDAARVDGPGDLLMLDGAAGMADLHSHAARSVGRILRAAGLPVAADSGDMGRAQGYPSEPVAQGFTVTDGHASYDINLVTATDAPPLLMFVGPVPPRGMDLYVVDHATNGPMLIETVGDQAGVICFTPGTRIATPEGPRLIEDIRPGDRISTKDDGAQAVLWTGHRRMTGARLHAMPHLRPIRICAGAMGKDRPDQDLIVSPQHRMLVQAGSALSLFNEPELLIAATDLVDGHMVRREMGLREVTYFHLLTERHQIVWANGLETESFHPANADLGMIEATQRATLFELLPNIAKDPFRYGDFARRNLTTPEAAILRYAAA